MNEVTTMASEDEGLILGRLSSESVREATGRGWEEWLEALDAAGAADWKHKEIVAYLEREHPDPGSSWWRQSITVGYEQARGKRAVGETPDAGFQVGVQRTVAGTATEGWELITSRPELWLGEGAAVVFAEGERYEVPPGNGAPGVSGEVRVVKPGTRLRMTWQAGGLDGTGDPSAHALGVRVREDRDPRSAGEASRRRRSGSDAQALAGGAGAAGDGGSVTFGTYMLLIQGPRSTQQSFDTIP